MRSSAPHRYLLLAVAVGFLCLGAYQPPRQEDRVILYLCGSQAIPPYEQHPTLRYLHDYPLTDRLPLNPRQQDSLWGLIHSGEYFIEGLSKSCRFEPVWALECSNFGKPSMQILLSASPCSKALLITPDQESWVVVPPDSPLEKFIKQCGG
ncbi:MAG: hypothetical protein AAFQ98_07295 [Bacteroidota bacterium]